MSKTISHTPAPWATDNGTVALTDQIDLLGQAIGTKNEWVCIGQPDEDNCETLQNVVALCHPSNAPIITAAPKMLDTLKGSHFFFTGLYDRLVNSREDAGLLEEISKTLEVISDTIKEANIKN